MVTLLPPSGDVIFLPLEFGLNFTKGSKFVYQKNIQIPAAWSCPLRVTASHLHHDSMDTQFMRSFFLLISSRNFNSLSCLLSSILQICEGCQKAVKLTWYSKSKKRQQWSSFSFFLIIITSIMIIITAIMIVFKSHNISFQSSKSNILSIYN